MRKSEFSRKRDGERGVALVEAAVILPIFFLLLFGVFEAGRFINTQQVVTNAAREGARFAVAPLSGTNGPISPAMTAGEVDPIVQQYLASAGVTGTITSFDPNVLVTTGGVQTSYTRVRVESQFNAITMQTFSMLNITLRGEALMRNEASN